MRILVIDDEPEMTALLSRGLTDDGHEVVTAHDGVAALGSVLEQQAAIDRPLPAQIPPPKLSAAPRLFELVNGLLADGADKTAEEAFETGLQLIVDGLRQRLAESKR